MLEDTSHMCLEQQSIKYIRKTSVGLSKNTDEKEKENTKKGNCKALCEKENISACDSD